MLRIEVMGPVRVIVSVRTAVPGHRMSANV